MVHMALFLRWPKLHSLCQWSFLEVWLMRNIIKQLPPSQAIVLLLCLYVSILVVVTVDYVVIPLVKEIYRCWWMPNFSMMQLPFKALKAHVHSCSTALWLFIRYINETSLLRSAGILPTSIIIMHLVVPACCRVLCFHIFRFWCLFRTEVTWLTCWFGWTYLINL